MIFEGNPELDLADAFNQSATQGYERYLNGVLNSARGLPISKENKKKAESWLKQRGIEIVCTTTQASSQEAAVASVVARSMNSEPTNVFLRIRNNHIIRANGILYLTAIAKMYDIRIYLFSTQSKPKIIGNSRAVHNISLLHEVDSYTAASCWYPLFIAKFTVARTIRSKQPTGKTPYINPAAIKKKQYSNIEKEEGTSIAWCDR